MFTVDGLVRCGMRVQSDCMTEREDEDFFDDPLNADLNDLTRLVKIQGSVPPSMAGKEHVIDVSPGHSIEMMHKKEQAKDTMAIAIEEIRRAAKILVDPDVFFPMLLRNTLSIFHADYSAV